jgi:hypothetical protein
MICEIAKKEIRQNLLSYKFSIITILSTILILVSIFVMYRDYCLAQEDHEIARAAVSGIETVLPPTPLGIFAKGLDE